MILPNDLENYCLDIHDFVIPMGEEGKRKEKQITGIYRMSEVTKIKFSDGTVIVTPDCFEFSMSFWQYRTCQERWIRNNKIATGSRVRVLRVAENYEDGWAQNWESSMDKTVGKIFTVEHIDPDNAGIVLAGYNGFSYPYYVLESQVDELKENPYKDIKVGQTWVLKNKYHFLSPIELIIISINPLKVLVSRYDKFLSQVGKDYTDKFVLWYADGMLQEQEVQRQVNFQEIWKSIGDMEALIRKVGSELRDLEESLQILRSYYTDVYPEE